jgi:hypothetical protein
VVGKAPLKAKLGRADAPFACAAGVGGARGTRNRGNRAAQTRSERNNGGPAMLTRSQLRQTFLRDPRQTFMRTAELGLERGLPNRFTANLYARPTANLYARLHNLAPTQVSGLREVLSLHRCIRCTSLHCNAGCLACVQRCNDATKSTSCRPLFRGRTPPCTGARTGK